MAEGLAGQLASLTRERDRLEQFLMLDANWRALRQLDDREAAGETLDVVDGTRLRRSLHAALAANRLYAARVKIVEAIEILEGTRALEPVNSVNSSGAVADPDCDRHRPSRRPRPGSISSRIVMLDGALDDASDASFRTRLRLKPAEPAGSPIAAPVAAMPTASPPQPPEPEAPPSEPPTTEVLEAIDQVGPAPEAPTPAASPVSTNLPSGFPAPCGTPSLAQIAVAIGSIAAAAQARSEPTRLWATATANTASAIAATATVEPSPAPTAEDAGDPRGADDLALIDGLDEEARALLQADGIVRFTQIARWTSTDARMWRQRLASRRGRVSGWIEQAAILASGRDTAYSSRMKSPGRAATSIEAVAIGALAGNETFTDRPSPAEDRIDEPKTLESPRLDAGQAGDQRELAASAVAQRSIPTARTPVPSGEEPAQGAEDPPPMISGVIARSALANGSEPPVEVIVIDAEDPEEQIEDVAPAREPPTLRWQRAFDRRGRDLVPVPQPEVLSVVSPESLDDGATAGDAAHGSSEAGFGDTGPTELIFDGWKFDEAGVDQTGVDQTGVDETGLDGVSFDDASLDLVSLEEAEIEIRIAPAEAVATEVKCAAAQGRDTAAVAPARWIAGANSDTPATLENATPSVETAVAGIVAGKQPTQVSAEPGERPEAIISQRRTAKPPCETSQGSLVDRLARAKAVEKFDPSDYAAYYDNVEEASVSIVRQPSEPDGTDTFPEPRGPGRPAAAVEGRRNGVHRPFGGLLRALTRRQ